MTITAGCGPLPSGVTRKPDPLSVPLLKVTASSAALDDATPAAASARAAARLKITRFMEDLLLGETRSGYRLQGACDRGLGRFSVQRAVAQHGRSDDEQLEAHEGADVGVAPGAEAVGVQAHAEDEVHPVP